MVFDIIIIPKICLFCNSSRSLYETPPFRSRRKSFVQFNVTMSKLMILLFDVGIDTDGVLIDVNYFGYENQADCRLPNASDFGS